jgi:methylated-DNA-[protein]-cysteine S-methyltransferase
MTDLQHALARAAATEAEPGGVIDNTRRLAARAADEGLLDVAYAGVDSPVGELTLAATPRGVVRIGFDSQSREAVLEELAALVSPRVLEAPGRLDQPRRELEEYFEGRRTRFDIDLDWSLTRGFFRRVLRATARIGYGEVSTYTEVAARAGSPRAVRAAGNALASNPIPILVPCHRVLRTGGALGGYGGGLERKQLLLRLEGGPL